MSIEIFHFVRFLHVVCASAWFGEVVVINFVLIPALSRYQGVYKKDFLNTIFPKIFNLASVLAGTTAVTGGILLYHFIGFDIISLTLKGTWGLSILIYRYAWLSAYYFSFFL